MRYAGGTTPQEDTVNRYQTAAAGYDTAMAALRAAKDKLTEAITAYDAANQDAQDAASELGACESRPGVPLPEYGPHCECGPGHPANGRQCYICELPAAPLDVAGELAAHTAAALSLIGAAADAEHASAAATFGTLTDYVTGEDIAPATAPLPTARNCPVCSAPQRWCDNPACGAVLAQGHWTHLSREAVMACLAMPGGRAVLGDPDRRPTS
jgi:hypothetical protein